MNITREALIERLRAGPTKVTFEKAESGEVRVMNCTLAESILPPRDAVIEGKERKANIHVLPVWDLDKQAWRSFRIDSLIEIV
jgi:hypothetical protein